MKRATPLATLVLSLGLWLGPAWAGEKPATGGLALSLVGSEAAREWKPDGENMTGWETLPLGAVKITTQELMAISGGGPIASPSPGDPPGKIILWDEFRPQSASTGVQSGNYGGASEGTQQNLIMAVGR